MDGAIYRISMCGIGEGGIDSLMKCNILVGLGLRNVVSGRLRSILVLILLFSFFFAYVTAAQSLPLVVSGGTHSLTVPWHLEPVTKRLNPALIVGTEHMLKSGKRIQLYYTANLGFFQHYWWMTGVYLNTELGMRQALPLGLYADMRLGVGDMHYFWRRKSLELEDGKYVQATNWGKPSLMVPLSLTFGYRGSSTRPISVVPFVSMQWAIQALFADEVPVMTHNLILVGVRMSTGGR